MHRRISDNYKSSPKNSKADSIFPESKIVKAECGENTSTGNFDIETVSVVFEPKGADFVDNKGFVGIVEY